MKVTWDRYRAIRLAMTHLVAVPHRTFFDCLDTPRPPACS
jgi:hypothetical protein